MKRQKTKIKIKNYNKTKKYILKGGSNSPYNSPNNPNNPKNLKCASTLEEYIKLLDTDKFKTFIASKYFINNNNKNNNNHFILSDYIDKDIKKILSSNQNTYFTNLIKILSCYIISKDIKTYTFDSNFNISNVETIETNCNATISCNLEEKLIYDKKIQCTKSICTGNYTITIGDITTNNKLCSIQVQMITMSHPDYKKGGHALTLIVNHTLKKYKVIDSNGGDTKLNTEVEFNVSNVENMIAKIITKQNSGYKVDNSMILPACQLNLSLYKGSCKIWSLLYIELILRFGYIITKTYLNNLYDNQRQTLLLQYATYMFSCLGDNFSNNFIYESSYILADTIKGLLNTYGSQYNINPTTITAPVLVIIPNKCFITYYNINNSEGWILYYKTIYKYEEINYNGNVSSLSRLSSLIKIQNKDFNIIKDELDLLLKPKPDKQTKIIKVDIVLDRKKHTNQKNENKKNYLYIYELIYAHYTKPGFTS